VTTTVPAIGPECPIAVPRCTMRNRWTDLTFLHWSYDPAAVQALLPPGLTVDTFDDRAWVALVPFVMHVRPPVGPELPWLSHFAETNVRTYVRAADGTAGVWFFSLDASRLPAVATARTTYHLPYFWSRMGYERDGDRVTYTCRRRWPGPGPSSAVTVRIGAPYAADELGDRDHWMTARWRLYSRRRVGLRSALAEHEVWPLHRAEVVHLDDGLVAAAGLPAPEGPPVVHWSPGVHVRIGVPRRLP
jgi:uncharacterized protein YqjF (DUF2071 family)